MWKSCDFINIPIYCLPQELRPNNLEDVSYLEFVQSFDFKRKDRVIRRPRAPNRVISCFPESKESNKENFGRVTLMLHHPFCRINNLKQVTTDLLYESFEEAYQHCKQVHSHPLDFYGKTLPDIDDQFKDSPPQNDDGSQQP
jgi:hypothetical protein